MKNLEEQVIEQLRSYRSASIRQLSIGVLKEFTPRNREMVARAVRRLMNKSILTATNEFDGNWQTYRLMK